MISPLLANVYLHHVLDLWIRKIARRLTGRVYLVRYCDDFVIGCTNRKDAERVWKMLQERVQKFGLEVSQEKSRVIEFGKKAYMKSKRKGEKLATLDFLGFTHFMTGGRNGGLKLGRKTIGKRMRRRLVALKTGSQETEKCYAIQGAIQTSGSNLEGLQQLIWIRRK